MLVRMVIPVLLDDWQLECCGNPPKVGQRASWQLNWTPEYGRMLRTDLSLSARVTALPDPGEDAWFSLPDPIDPSARESIPALATAGGVTVFVEAPKPPPEHVTLTGVLHEDHHVGVPPEMSTTTGTIQALWLVSWEYEERADAWYPIRESARLHQVDRVPRWFSNEPTGQPNRHTANVLAHLDVDPPS